jgi:chloride channel 3/4/5
MVIQHLAFCCTTSNNCKIIFLPNSRLSWPEVMGSGKTGAGPYTVAYLFYVIWALVFASLAACLVRMFAPYGNLGDANYGT